ncbi:MAG: hypothetical protein EXX96DRAFT_549827 [Benjaminiella poitrasii]|nr:MAG: hypothetical protein EXX96DRAFT_549827 [Benjaminiella poitrasii]
MTHLSDFSFLQRMVSFGYLYVWYTYRVWTLDKFSCLHPKRFQQGELKSIVTLLVLFMIPFQLFYDITSVKIKYEEGFANVFGRIFTKPEVMWTEADRKLVIPTEYSLCIGFSLQTGTLVLLQCFWNYLANSVAKASFMSSKEFMFYICWTFSSFIIFPLLQYNFSREIYEPTYKEIIPEMVYGIELFVVGCLGVVSHFRFKKLLSNSRDTANGRSISHKIQYFQDINKVLSTVLFGHGSLLTVLSCDGLTNRKTLNAHKFSADFFICNINMCAVITWLCMILIFHPKHTSSTDNVNENDRNPFTDDNNDKQIHNASGISSTNTYAHASTLVLGVSQASSEYTYKDSTFSHHPLSKSWIAASIVEDISDSSSSIINNDSAFQFGPLPIPPPSESVNCCKNNSTVSAAPSMSTLVSSHQMNVHHGSQGKGSNSRRSTKGSIFHGGNNDMDYFHHNKSTHPMPDDSKSAFDKNDHTTKKASSIFQHQQRSYEELEMNDLDVKRKHANSMSKKGFHHLEDEEACYVPPPLSPARKSRDNTGHHSSLVVGSDCRRYMHSMNVQACKEDMDEFGINKKKQSKISIPNDTVIHFGAPNSRSQLQAGEEILYDSSSSVNEFKKFQQQQSINNSSLTSYRDFGNSNNSSLRIDVEATKKYPSASMNPHSSLLINGKPTFETTSVSKKNSRQLIKNEESIDNNYHHSTNSFIAAPLPPSYNIPTTSLHNSKYSQSG